MSSKLGCATLLSECERSFRAALHSDCFPSFTATQRWVIAHSGGIDSQVLLALAARFLPLDTLVVLHVNHHLQPASEAWADFSMQQAAQLGIKGIVLNVFPENASELAARDARYAAFESTLQDGDCLLLGQHADDQAETLLYRWLRGAGLTGVSGMPLQRTLGEGRLYRPLLACSRKSIESVAQELQLTYVEDETNQSCHYDRNYLRHKVIPHIEARWPDFQQRWQKNAEQIAQSAVLLNEYLDEEIASCVKESGILDLTRLHEFAKHKQSALLRRWLEVETGVLLNQDRLDVIDTELVGAQLDAVPMYSLGKYQLRRYKHQLYICMNESVVPVSSKFPVIDVGEFELGDGVLKVSTADSGCALKQLDGLEIRRRQGGEKLRPAGRNMTKTVKQLMQEAGIPPWLRQQWPLIFSGEELVAIPGICVSEGWQAKNTGFSILWCSNSLSD